MNLKKLRIGTLALTSVVALSTTPTFAQDTTEVENAFSQCGIGASIFKNNETAAIISNVIWDLGTTALSSQTSSPESCSGAATTAALFINETYPVLEEQLVKGEGSHVVALMDIMQCDQANHGAFVSSIQNELSGSFAKPQFVNASQTEKAKQVGGMVDRAISSCNA